MTFFTFIYKNLVRRKARSALTAGGVAVAVGAVVALVGVSQGFERSFVELYEKRGVDLLVLQAGRIQGLNSYLNQDYAEQIRALPNIEAATPILFDLISLDDTPNGLLVQGWAAGSSLFNDITIESGHGLKAGQRKQILLGDVLAKNLGKKVGDTLKLPYDEDKPFQVVGIFDSFSQYEKGAAVMLLDELQEYMDLANPPKVSAFQVKVGKPADRATIEEARKEIEGLNKQLSATHASDYVRSTTQIRIATSTAWITSAIALLIGVIGILNTMIMSVFERTREIGILRAVGWRKGRVIRMILGESVLLSITGAILGTLGAIGVTWLLSTLPPVNSVVRADVAPSVIVTGFVIALAVGLLGGAYPAYRAAQLLPTEAIRHE